MTRHGYGAGHGGSDPGAVSQGWVERDIARTMNAELIRVALSSGWQVVNLTIDKGYPYNINEPVQLANANGVEVAIQNHFNAGGGNGCEVLYYAGDGASGSKAAAMSAAIAGAYGLRNRGAQARGDLGFINGTNMPGFIVEWGFVDSPGNVDVPKIMANPTIGCQALIRSLGGSVAPVVKPEQKLGEPKNSLNVCGQAHVATLGWLDRGRDGQNLGTTGFGLNMEAMIWDLSNMNMPGEVEFELTPNVQNQGQVKTYRVGNKTPTLVIGSTGKGQRFEGTAIRQVRNTTPCDFFLQFHQAGTGWGQIIKIEDAVKYLGSEGLGNGIQCFRLWAQKRIS